MNEKPSFYIGNIPIQGKLILAPMDGVSDQPFRVLTRKMGSAISYTEFINAIDVTRRHPHLEQRLQFLEIERPIAYQIFDDDPDRLLRAAVKLEQRKPDFIDINMGCSARTVTGRGAGASLLRDPKKIAGIFNRLAQTLSVPVTGKIRLGWDEETLNYLEIAKIIEDNGGKMIAVHGRTRSQTYQHPADWEPIAQIKQAVSIPVIGNGDITCMADIQRMQALTHCDGIMIGRAAISNPWLFSGYDREQVPIPLLRETILLHLQELINFYGAKRAIILFRKFVKRYLSPHAIDKEILNGLLTCEDPDQFYILLTGILAQLTNVPLREVGE